MSIPFEPYIEEFEDKIVVPAHIGNRQFIDVSLPKNLTEGELFEMVEEYTSGYGAWVFIPLHRFRNEDNLQN